MDRALVILNPAARGEKASADRERILKLAPGAVIRTTNAAGDAEALAERGVEQGFKLIVAAGGDGTINEVVNGIAEADVTLGLLPSGTMNVFATELGIPTDMRKCWDIIANGVTREVDLAVANDQYFVQLAGIGLDAQVVKETRREDKRAFGPLSYLVSAAQIASRKPPLICVDTPDRGRLSGSFVLIGNGRLYGGPFPLFKLAKIDDGLLDVLIFKNLGYIEIMRYLQGVLFGTHIDMPDVEYVQTREARVTSTADVPVEVDGELLGNVPVTFGFARRKLNVRVPRAKDRKR
jgi:YegS/Rv2252/BmrU family lipid kinase